MRLEGAIYPWWHLLEERNTKNKRQSRGMGYNYISYKYQKSPKRSSCGWCRVSTGDVMALAPRTLRSVAAEGGACAALPNDRPPSSSPPIPMPPPPPPTFPNIETRSSNGLLEVPESKLAAAGVVERTCVAASPDGCPSVAG